MQMLTIKEWVNINIRMAPEQTQQEQQQQQQHNHHQSHFSHLYLPTPNSHLIIQIHSLHVPGKTNQLSVRLCKQMMERQMYLTVTMTGLSNVHMLPLPLDHRQKQHLSMLVWMQGNLTMAPPHIQPSRTHKLVLQALKHPPHMPAAQCQCWEVLLLEEASPSSSMLHSWHAGQLLRRLSL
jgi:hypothetical protein